MKVRRVVMDRREFLSLTALTAASTAAGKLGLGAPKPSPSPADFDFIFLTDTHIQPELNAADGCAMCFKKARSIPAR